jgi:L-ascorbate metabolism protein UlaG (beta-lactamase superfamily)
MRCFPCIPAVVLLSCTAMSGSCGAQERGLSGDRVPAGASVLVIHPIHHATFLMQCNGKTVFVDPVGGAKPFAGLPKPDLVLVIRQFRPKIVYPYHYRSGDGTKANLEELKRLVGEQSGVEIRSRDWYPER